MFKIFLTNLILISWAAPALADSWAATALADVFKVVDNVLYFDTENSEITDEISSGHEEELLTILKKHNECTTSHQFLKNMFNWIIKSKIFRTKLKTYLKKGHKI